MSVTGVLISGSNVDEAVLKISTAWHKATQSIIQTAQLLLEYKFSSEWTEIQNRLIKDKIMSGTVISMLTNIAENPILTAPENIPLLPASYNTLYQLHKLDNDLPRVLSEGQVTPDLTFEGVRDIRTKLEEKRGVVKTQKKERTEQMVTFAKLKIPSLGYEENLESLIQVLNELQSQFPFIEFEFTKK